MKQNYLPSAPAVPLLCIAPEESKADDQTKTCTLMFIAPLFTVAKTHQIRSDQLLSRVQLFVTP